MFCHDGRSDAPKGDRFLQLLVVVVAGAGRPIASVVLLLPRSSSLAQVLAGGVFAWVQGSCKARQVTWREEGLSAVRSCDKSVGCLSAGGRSKEARPMVDGGCFSLDVLCGGQELTMWQDVDRFCSIYFFGAFCGVEEL